MNVDEGKSQYILCRGCAKLEICLTKSGSERGSLADIYVVATSEILRIAITAATSGR